MRNRIGRLMGGPSLAGYSPYLCQVPSLSVQAFFSPVSLFLLITEKEVYLSFSGLKLLLLPFIPSGHHLRIYLFQVSSAFLYAPPCSFCWAQCKSNLQTHMSFQNHSTQLLLLAAIINSYFKTKNFSMNGHCLPISLHPVSSPQSYSALAKTMRQQLVLITLTASPLWLPKCLKRILHEQLR